MKFTNAYLDLSDVFYQINRPTKVKQPELFLFNERLAQQLNFNQQELQDTELLAQVFSGNAIEPSSTPISLAYAGHQFGHFSPQLGDGRAHLLGELKDNSDQLWEVQLKGSGPSRFSRNGDGRCGLRPALREYIMSEALHALRVPTTRTLAVVMTGEEVYRESVMPGAVVTRIAKSHLRVGSFQYFAAQGDVESVKILADMALHRHYPDLMAQENRYLGLINRVIEKQIYLITEWLRIGFIHGVMNTDNVLISGDTIDYGPCAMLGIYKPDTVFSSIDHQGRYAFMQQPEIAQWNLTRFAECLLPLIDSDPDQAIAKVLPSIEAIAAQFKTAFFDMYAQKLGMQKAGKDEIELIQQLLRLMEQHEMDYTLSFNGLTHSFEGAVLKSELAPLEGWMEQWHKHLHKLGRTDQEAYSLMRQKNPILIPRNHHVESILQQCELMNSPEPAEHFLKALSSPYQAVSETLFYQDAAKDSDQHYQTFCGT